METNITGLSLDFIIHPGETVKELITDNNMSQEELAQRTNFSPKHISQIINGKKRITAQFAKSLEYVFGIETTFWLNLQAIYDREIIDFQERNEITKKEIEISKRIDSILKYANTLGLIDKYSNDIERVIVARNFCQITNLLNIEKILKLQVAYKNTINTVDEYVLYAWQRMCELIASKENIKNEFNKEILLKNIKKIQSEMNNKDNKDVIKNLRKSLKEAGIILVIAKDFKGVSVDGFIENKNNRIVLCITDKNKIDNNFWFILFHEISHILNNDIQSNSFEYYINNSDIEKRADKLALELMNNV